ncbi:hypothetical protein KUM39_21940 [Streptomyces sp. J2-1]|uniref:hypothetical protein n=1 Tax=Streptomyces corallincola TaxID=2851888 RepID=UPI001C3953E1|nr:hypothetical protein [Streptomyces corallincola]MBV2357001.1 hypothetical protein [Streptomyces corallincola]
MADGGPVEHGFPHLETVRAAVTALYRRLSYDGVRSFATSVAPADVAFTDGEDLHLGAQRVARALVAHFRLPDARLVVAFRDMTHAAEVELTAGPEFFVELNDRFRTHRADIGAALAHEVAHVYLHRLGLAFPTTAENEILTDTVTTYLGAGWLLLDAYREDRLTSQKLGYLTPEEFGYVLARRAALFGEDPSVWFSSAQGYPAYLRGRERAGRDARRAPLADAGWTARRRYALDRRLAANGHPHPARPDSPYEFTRSADGGELRVAFPCPLCGQRIGVPSRGRLRARCGLCGTVLECET